jgi:hypothetical protein
MIFNQAEMQDCKISAASFRDPSGFIFSHGGVLYRQVNKSYKPHFTALVDSGLYAVLADQRMLIPHKEVEEPVADENSVWRVIRPEPIAFVSYPYEWSFSQFKDAAMLTLDIQLTAMEYGMCLKDASAYNIQFQDGRPVLIDTLSLEIYEEGRPWAAYRQFCQHFLAPLALMANVDIRLNKLLFAYIDGVPLDLASHLMPRASWLGAGLLMHLHAHAMAQKKYAAGLPEKNEKHLTTRHISKNVLTGIVHSLRKTVQKLDWQPGGTEWGDYYDATNYSESAFKEKEKIVSKFLRQAQPEKVWDLGGNTGFFSRIASDIGIPTVSFDVDCVFRRSRPPVPDEVDHPFRMISATCSD